jgi:DNA primase
MSCASIQPREFTMDVVLDRCAKQGDLFAPVLEEPRPLAPAARVVAALG